MKKNTWVLSLDEKLPALFPKQMRNRENENSTIYRESGIKELEAGVVMFRTML